ncbi:MAG: hypothetical protein ACT4PY_06475 [Armatimonadota bacterium]
MHRLTETIMLHIIVRRAAVPVTAALLALTGFWVGASYLPGRAAQPKNAGLRYSVAMPIPVASAKASGVPRLREALGHIRKAIPAVSMVHLVVANGVTSEADWLALLDAVRGQGFRATMAFAVPTDDAGASTGFRPVRADGGWKAGSLGAFAACAKCVTHPALHAVQVVEEPWHHSKQPFYTTDELRSLIDYLKSRSPGAARVRWFVQFSRGLWSQTQDPPRPDTTWEEGLGAIVQISALEFQDRQYQFVLLDQNHYWSRRVIHDKTPEILLWSSVQVMGAGYGPAPGYWFPRERGGQHDLFRLLSDLVETKYQNEHPLAGLVFWQWDSPSVSRRKQQYTLGDRYLKDQPVSQVSASEDALRTINAWIRGSGASR